MTESDWRELAHKNVTVDFGFEVRCRLKAFLACGGAGAVYEFCNFWDLRASSWVIKVLDPDSPVAQQELASLKTYRGEMRHADGLMKFSSWEGVLTFDGRKFPAYLMRKGKTLGNAIRENMAFLTDPNAIIRLIAYMIKGVSALKNAGLSHGDIKEDNILLMEYKKTFIPMLSDYGTVSPCYVSAKSVAYVCEETEYSSELEERIAFDLYCIRRVICVICKRDIEDDNLSDLVPDLRNILRIIRNTDKKAFERLDELLNLLQDNVKVHVSFYLDNVPSYSLKELPFEAVKKWGEYVILRERNITPGEAFDPVLLMKIPSGHYEKVYDILSSVNRREMFVMPIARYFDEEGNEYVLIHAPDDKNKHIPHSLRQADHINTRIQDSAGEPYTLETLKEAFRFREMKWIIEKLLPLKINIEISPEDIWYMDHSWKLNLFSVKSIGFTEKNAETCRIEWK